MSRAPRRFAVALSFPGERRAFVERVACALLDSFGGTERGRSRIFYDRWHEPRFVGFASARRLQEIYADAELIVPFYCKDYLSKPWCGTELRVIEELLFDQEFDRVLPFRFDTATVPGSFRTDIFPDVSERTAEEVAGLVFARYKHLRLSRPTRGAQRQTDSVNDVRATKIQLAPPRATTVGTVDRPAHKRKRAERMIPHSEAYLQVVERFERFHPAFVSADQLDDLRAFAVRQMGPSIAPADVLRGWYAVNQRIFYSLCEIQRSQFVTSTRLAGYYSLRPINAQAVAELDAGRIDGAGLRPEHILPPDVVPPAVYVGGVAGDDSLSKAAVLFYLECEASRYRSQGVKVFYAKPVTEDGIRLVGRHGFLPINAAGEPSKGVYRRIFP